MFEYEILKLVSVRRNTLVPKPDSRETWHLRSLEVQNMHLCVRCRGCLIGNPHRGNPSQIFAKFSNHCAWFLELMAKRLH